MAAGPERPRFRVDIDAAAIWAPLGQAEQGAPAARAHGLSIQSWNVRPPRRRAEDGPSPCDLVIVENRQEARLDDGSVIVVSKGREWELDARYVETREFPAPDGSPRPKHFFEVEVPDDLGERLRDSPEDILAKSDLYDGELPKAAR
jgi:hypothetical protein